MSLAKYALITFLIGLIALFFLSENLEPKLVEIKDIKGSMMDKTVRIQGQLIKIKQTDAMSILTIDDKTDSISVLSPKTNISINSSLEIIGKVTEYKGILEIESEKIIVN
jgi:RecJ-like exonuclease